MDVMPPGSAAGSEMRHDIVLFAPSEWLVVRGLPENTAMQLALAGHRVLVVEPFHTVLSVARMARLQNRAAEWRAGMRQVANCLWVWRPPPLGIPGRTRSTLPARLSARLLGLLVRRACRRLGFHKPLAWSFPYETGHTMATMGAALRVYDCGDFEAALAGNAQQRQTVIAMEAETCRMADLVFACTEELAAVLRGHNPNTFAVPCAADVGYFARAREPDLKVPDDIARLPRPVLGYMGGLDPFKIDVALIRDIARLRPNWSIAMVGYIWFGFDPATFADVPNVHILGPKEHAMFPAYLKGMDVGLLPFPDNEITRYGDALKTYEYLAAGLPVVGRPVPSVRRLPDLVRIAHNAEDFVRATEAALAEDEAAREYRRSAIAAHDWRVRVALKLTLIEAALRQRQPLAGR